MRRPSGPLGSMPQTARLIRSVGVALDQLLGGLGAQAAREQRVVAVELVCHLLPVRWTLSALTTTTKSPASTWRGEGRLVLAAQHVGDLRAARPSVFPSTSAMYQAVVRTSVGLKRGAVVCARLPAWSGVFTGAARLCQRAARPVRRGREVPGRWRRRRAAPGRRVVGLDQGEADVAPRRRARTRPRGDRDAGLVEQLRGEGDGAQVPSAAGNGRPDEHRGDRARDRPAGGARARWRAGWRAGDRASRLASTSASQEASAVAAASWAGPKMP